MYTTGGEKYVFYKAGLQWPPGVQGGEECKMDIGTLENKVILAKLEELKSLHSCASLCQEEGASFRKAEECTGRLKCLHWKPRDGPSKAMLKTGVSEKNQK